MSIFFFQPRKLWAVQWTEGGKKKRRYFKTEQEAAAFQDELLTARTAGHDRLTVGELVVAFFRSHPDYHPKTKENILFALTGREGTRGEHVEGPAEFLRDKYADVLSRRDLERMREELRLRKNGNNSINKHQAYIRAILAWGADQELIARNPWRDFKRLPVERKQVMTSILDVRRVYHAAPDWLQWAIMTMYALTLRAGHVELFGLMWSSFDWRRGVVYVKQAKSGRMKTVYPPPAYLEIAYARYKDDSAGGIPWVCHRGGRRVLDYRTAWGKAVKDAGMEHIPMTHVRHASVSELLAATGDIAAAAAQAGHSSVNTTGTFYAHVTPGGQKRAAALLPSIEDDEK